MGNITKNLLNCTQDTIFISNDKVGVEEMRELVSLFFLLEQDEMNGFPVYQHSKTVLQLSHHSVMMALTLNIEDGFIEEYGSELGKKNAIEFYGYMLEPSPDLELECRLSQMGRDTMKELFNSFIYHFEANGIPSIGLLN